MNPEEVAAAIQMWINKSNPPLKKIRRTVHLLMVERYSVDPVKKQVFDQADEETGNAKEGFTVKMIRNSMDEFRIQFIQAEIQCPKPKVGRPIASSSVEEKETFNVVDLFYEMYK